MLEDCKSGPFGEISYPQCVTDCLRSRDQPLAHQHGDTTPSNAALRHILGQATAAGYIVIGALTCINAVFRLARVEPQQGCSPDG